MSINKHTLLYTDHIPVTKHRIIDHTKNGPIVYCYYNKLKTIGVYTSSGTICKACNKHF